MLAKWCDNEILICSTSNIKFKKKQLPPLHSILNNFNTMQTMPMPRRMPRAKFYMTSAANTTTAGLERWLPGMKYKYKTISCMGERENAGTEWLNWECYFYTTYLHAANSYIRRPLVSWIKYTCNTLVCAPGNIIWILIK